MDALTEFQKQRLFDVAERCFALIKPDDEDEDEVRSEKMAIANTSQTDNMTKEDLSFQQAAVNNRGSVAFSRKSTRIPPNLTEPMAKRFQEQRKQIKELEKALENVPDGLKLWQIQNDGGVSLLHQAAIKN